MDQANKGVLRPDVEITEPEGTPPQTSKAFIPQSPIDIHPYTEENDKTQPDGVHQSQHGDRVSGTKQEGIANETQPDVAVASDTQQGGGANKSQQGGGANETQPDIAVVNDTQQGGGANKSQQGGGANETQPDVAVASDTQQGGGANKSQQGGGANETQPDVAVANDTQQGGGANKSQQGGGANETQPDAAVANDTHQGGGANETQPDVAVANETQQAGGANETQSSVAIDTHQGGGANATQQAGGANETQPAVANGSQQGSGENEIQPDISPPSQQRDGANTPQPSRAIVSQQGGGANGTQANRAHQSHQGGLYQPVPPQSRPNRPQNNVTQTTENGRTYLPHPPDVVNTTHQQQSDTRYIQTQPEEDRQQDGLFKPVPPPSRPNQTQPEEARQPDGLFKPVPPPSRPNQTQPEEARQQDGLFKPVPPPSRPNQTQPEEARQQDGLFKPVPPPSRPNQTQPEEARQQDGLFKPVPPPSRPNQTQPEEARQPDSENSGAYLPHPPEELQHSESLSSLNKSNTGILPYKRSNVVNTFLFSKQIRTISRLRKIEKAYLCISMLYFLTALIITICRLATMNNASSLLTMEVVLLLNTLFCVYYLVSGIFFERPYEIICLVFSTCCLSSYLAVNYFFGTKGAFKQVRLIVSCMLTPCVVVMGSYFIQRYREADNLVIQTVGAGTELQYSCGIMFLFFGSLKMDLQSSLSLAMLNLSSPDLDLNLLFPLMLVFGIGSCVCGYMMVRYEKKYLVMVYAVLWFILPGCAIYMMIEYVERVTSEPDIKGVMPEPNVSNLKYRLCILSWCIGSVTIVLRICSLICSVLVCRNFGKGLKEKVFGLQEPSASDTSPENEQTMETVL